MQRRAVSAFTLGARDAACGKLRLADYNPPFVVNDDRDVGTRSLSQPQTWPR